MSDVKNNKTIKITIVIPGMNRGGAERVAAYLANYISHNGYLVDIIVLGNAVSDYMLENNVKLHGLNIKSSSKIKVVTKLRHIIKNLNSNILLCFSMKMTIYSLLATVGLRIKVVGSDRSNPFFAYGDSMSKGLVAWILSRANGFIFLTEGGRNYYSESIRKKSIVIPNGVFAEYDYPSCIEFHMRDKNMICAVGRLSPVKDYETMLNIFSIFLKKHPMYKLHIFGDGELRNSLEEQTRSLNIEKSVIFEGVVDDIIEKIKYASMFIHTSKSESWCNALMEALSCGIPSVVMDCDFGPRSMIVNGINGILVPLGDINSFVNAMNRIAEYKDYAKMISNNAMKIKVTNNPEIISKKYLNYLEGIYNEI